MSFTHFKIETDADGIALVTWDSPGRSMNVIDPKVTEELTAIATQVAGERRSRPPSSPRARRRSAPAPISLCLKR